MMSNEPPVVSFFSSELAQIVLLQRVRQPLEILVLLLSLILAIFSIRDVLAQATCSANPLVANDLIKVDAVPSGGVLHLLAYTRQPFGGIAITTSQRFDFFIDADQNRNTGDPRPGAIRGMDYVVRCIILIQEMPVCHLYQLPSDILGEQQNLGQLNAVIHPPNILSVAIHSGYHPSDIVAFARGGIGFYGNKTGNGDRCPDSGVFDTAIRHSVVREPAPPVDEAVLDSTGPDLLGWRFQTFGDQFRLQIDYQYAVDPLSLAFSGRIELDTDRDLNTGLVQTPFLIPSPFNEIASWGWDVAIEFMGGGGTASDPTPFSLDFGTQSNFIIPPSSTYAFPFYFPFGEGYNDGRWYISGNQVVLEGSLSMLDARRWRIIPGTGLVVDKRSTTGQVTGRLFTRSGSLVTDMLPKHDKAFDFGTGIEMPAIRWRPEAMVSGSSPIDRLPQFDLIRVDAQIDGDHLVVAGTLARLESTWSLTGFAVFLETDPQTGTPINNQEYNTEIIMADYTFGVSPVDLLGYIGYRTLLIKPDGSQEGRDSGLTMRFSRPWEVSSPAKFIVTIPLAVIGNPQGPIRLYAATFHSTSVLIDDVAPLAPLVLTASPVTTHELTVAKAGAGSGLATSDPAGIDCGSACTAIYASRTSVTLTATPAHGSRFTGWSGACSGASACTLTMDAAKSVTATFTPVATDFQTAAGTISWFYAAAFNRTPIPNSALPNYGDIGGLAFWTQAYLTGAGGLAAYRNNVYAIADFFVGSDEFQAQYPASLTNEQFVTALYDNMLGRAADVGGLAFWVGRLNSGVSRGAVLADFTNSEENRNANPLRRRALESFIAFIDADRDRVITPEEAAVWLAENPDLDGAVVDGN